MKKKAAKKKFTPKPRKGQKKGTAHARKIGCAYYAKRKVFGHWAMVQVPVASVKKAKAAARKKK